VQRRDATSQYAEPQQGQQNGSRFTCAECGKELTETKFKDGSVWDVSKLAGYGRRKHNRVLCMEHYRNANALLQARN
jgi:hypothetical protein